MSYVKKYDVGQIKLDLPTANYIHELPLLSFGDVQHTINLSLIFNYANRTDDSFNIAPGYKLNLQKQIVINSSTELPEQFIDENGKTIDLIKNGSVYTFDDDSMRILKKTEKVIMPFDPDPKDGLIPLPITYYEYTVEYPDYSKEKYTQDGELSAVYDKYGVKYLEYTYYGNVLEKITYKSDKEIVLDYSGTTLSSIIYTGVCTTEVSFNGNNATIEHYSGIDYSLNLSGKDFTVTATGNESGSTVSYFKGIEFGSDGIVLSEGKNGNATNTIKYQSPFSMEESLASVEYFDVVHDQLRTRVQPDGEKAKYIYEVDGDGPVFYNGPINYNQGHYIGTVQTFRTENSLDSVNIKFADGVSVGDIQTGISRLVSLNNLRENGDSGFFIFSGWVKASISGEYTINIDGQDYRLPLTTNAIFSSWKFFAIRFDLESAKNEVIIEAESQNSAVEFKGLKVTFHPSSTPVLINKINDEMYTLSSDKFEHMASSIDPYYDAVLLNDLMRYKTNKLKDVNTGIFFYNNGKNVVSGISNLSVRVNGNTISLDQFDLATKCVKSGDTYISRTVFDTGAIVTTNKIGDNVVSSQTLNSFLDVVSATDEDGVTIEYTRNNGLLTSESVNGLYSKSISYESYSGDDPTITVTDEHGYETVYTLDGIWGNIKSIELPDGNIIADEYDTETYMRTDRTFSGNRTNTIYYSAGNASSMSNGDLSYEFEYTDRGDLSSVTKNNTTPLEEHIYSYGDRKVESYYPLKSGALYSQIAHYDKYGRVNSIENLYEAVYDINPTYLIDDITYRTYGRNATGSKLAIFTDKLRNETTKYGYDQDRLEKIATFNSSGTKIADDTLDYDSRDRLVSNEYKYDTMNKSIKSVIIYDDDDDRAIKRNRVKTYKQFINGEATAKAQTENEFDEYKRLTQKVHSVGGRVFGKAFEYSATRPVSITYDSDEIISYEYDPVGRISKITQNGKAIEYTYDEYGQLEKEEHQNAEGNIDKTIEYVYNDIGNVDSVSVNGSVTQFGYSNQQPEQLTNYKNTNITYNSIGYPVTYGRKRFEWTQGKLTKYYDEADPGAVLSSENIEYSYNALGQRMSKEYVYDPGPDYSGDFSIGKEVAYNYDNSGRLIREFSTEYFTESASVTRELIFLYDESGMIGYTYSRNGATPQAYYYQRNLLGDVIAIYNTNGVKKAGYTYDAYGNCTISNVGDFELANNNPIRYRGYYYDSETNWYYLNARYYSPEWRRFISPDDTAYLDPESVNGLNLYCYCNNDPVNYCDPSGRSIILTLSLIGLGLGVGLGVGYAVYTDYQDDYSINGSIGLDYLWLGIIGGATGLMLGFTIGYFGPTIASYFGAALPSIGGSQALAVVGGGTVTVANVGALGAMLAAGLGITFFAKPNSGPIRFSDGTGLDPLTGKPVTDQKRAYEIYRSLTDPLKKANWKKWLKGKGWRTNHLK